MANEHAYSYILPEENRDMSAPAFTYLGSRIAEHRWPAFVCLYFFIKKNPMASRDRKQQCVAPLVMPCIPTECYALLLCRFNQPAESESSTTGDLESEGRFFTALRRVHSTGHGTCCSFPCLISLWGNNEKREGRQASLCLDLTRSCTELESKPCQGDLIT